MALSIETRPGDVILLGRITIHVRKKARSSYHLTIDAPADVKIDHDKSQRRPTERGLRYGEWQGEATRLEQYETNLAQLSAAWPESVERPRLLAAYDKMVAEAGLEADTA